MAWVIENAPEKKGKGWKIGEKGEAPKKDYRLVDIPGAAAEHFIPNLKEVGGYFAEMAKHPIDTISGIDTLLTGLRSQAMPEDSSPVMREMMGILPEDREGSEAVAASVKQALKEQYGGYENIKRTLAERPVESLIDALSLGTGGASMLSSVPGKVGAVASKIAAPGKAIASAPAKLLQGPMDVIGKKLYGSAIKFPEEVGFEGRRAAIETGRKKGITLDEPGAIKLKDEISKLGGELDDILEKAEKAGAKADVIELWDKVDDLKMGSELSARPVKLQRAVDSIINEHLAAMENVGKSFYTPKDLNTLKRALAGRAKYSSTPGTATLPDAALVDAKAAAVARETLEGMDPQVAALNQQLSPLMALRGPQYSAAFKGRQISPHAIIGGAAARQVAPGGLSAPASLAAMLVGPGRLAKGGIAATKIAENPVLRSLLNVAPIGGYYGNRLIEDKK